MIKLVFIFILFASLFSGAYSKSSGDEITPYGAYCPLCGDYGYCNKQPTQKEITDALKSFYSKKGLRVVLIKQDGQNQVYILTGLYSSPLLQAAFPPRLPLFWVQLFIIYSKYLRNIM